MIIRMENAEGLSLPQMEALLETSQEVRFAAKGRKEIYEWVERVLVRQEYAMQGKRTAGGGAGIPGEDDGEVAAADHPSGATVPGDGAGAGADLPAAQICPGVYGGGRALAGAGGSGARAAERTGHAADPGTGGRGVRPPGICAADADLGGALVQSAKETGLSETGSALRSYPPREDFHRRATASGPARPARIPAGGHGAPGRLGWTQGCVSHQLGGRRDAMGGGGMRADNQCGISETPIGSPDGAASRADPGLPRGQRIGVHQSRDGETARRLAGGVHQIAGLPIERQRSGGGQEWGHHPQAHGIRTYPRGARHAHSGVLRPILESVLELSPAVWVCHRYGGRERKAPPQVSVGGLCHALREAEVTQGRRSSSPAGVELGGFGTNREIRQRHGVCRAHAARQDRARNDPRQMAHAVEAAIHRVDPDQAVSNVQTMDEGCGSAKWSRRCRRRGKLGNESPSAACASCAALGSIRKWNISLRWGSAPNPGPAGPPPAAPVQPVVGWVGIGWFGLGWLVWNWVGLEMQSPSSRRQKGVPAIPPISGSSFDWKMLMPVACRTLYNCLVTLNRALKSVCCLAAWSAALAAATTTAYVPVCCNANSTVSIVGTAHNRVAADFTAGPGSYAVALPNSGAAWVANAGNNTISIVSLKTGAVLKTLQLKLQPWLIQASPDGANVYVVTGMFTGNLNHYSSALQVFKARTGALAGNVALPNDGLANPGLAVAPDSSRVYATFDSQTVVVYDVATGMVVSTWQTTRALTWTASGTLTLSPDGDRKSTRL